jgi:thiol-disulfide isomerase/thioredoxin
MHFVPKIGYGTSKGENRGMRLDEKIFCTSILAFALFALGGCDRATGTTAGGKGAPPAEHVSSVEPIPAVEILSWDEAQKRREQFRGKVVVLDVWSTFCDPCVREFPNLVKLQARLGDKVGCISFNTDYTGAKGEPPESFRKRVQEFLITQKARLFNVLSSDPNEEFFTEIHLGGPPAVFVYDRQGQLIKRFDNSQVPKTPEFTYQNDVVPLVERLLAQPDSGRH